MNCVPFALSLLTGVPAADVKTQLQEDGGYSSRKGAFPRTIYIPLLEKLGGKITARVESPRMTVRHWAAIRAQHNDRAPWLVRISGHLMVYRDGALYDNAHPAGDAMARCGNSRVAHAWQVEVPS